MTHVVFREHCSLCHWKRLGLPCTRVIMFKASTILQSLWEFLCRLPHWKGWSETHAKQWPPKVRGGKCHIPPPSSAGPRPSGLQQAGVLALVSTLRCSIQSIGNEHGLLELKGKRFSRARCWSSSPRSFSGGIESVSADGGFGPPLHPWLPQTTALALRQRHLFSPSFPGTISTSALRI